MIICGKVDYVVEDELRLKGMTISGLKDWRCPTRPYFYIEKGLKNFECIGVQGVEDVDLKYRDVDGKEFDVKKVEMMYPFHVKRAREYVRKLGYKSFESDIPFVRRLMVDRRLLVDYSFDNLVYLDIEVYDEHFPTEYGEYQILCVGVMDEKKEEWFYGKEEEMLMELLAWLRKHNKSVIVGWNVGFDYGHLTKRIEKLGIEDEYLNYCNTIDLKPLYEFSVKGLSSYSLAEVSKHEGWREKGREKRVYRMSKDELYKYNMYDVELLRLIEERYGFLSLELSLANFLNLTLDNLSPLRIGDTLVLRRLRELGYVAKDGENVEGETDYRGAFVKTPEPGIHRNVVVFDFSAMYPSIIINEKIDIDGFNGEVLPYVVESVKEKRFEYKRLYKETGDKKYNILQKAMKPILNCFSEDTYIVTVDGIKSVKDMKVGDKVYSVNPKTLEVEIDEVEKVWEYDYDGVMYHFYNNRQVDLMVTPNHRFLLIKNGKIKWYTAEEMYNRKTKEYIPKPILKEESSTKSIKDKICLLDYVYKASSEFGYEYDLVIWSEIDIRKFFKKLPEYLVEKIRKKGEYYGVGKYRINIKELSEIEIYLLSSNADENVRVGVRRHGMGKASVFPLFFDKEKFVELLGWYISEGSAKIYKEKEYKKTKRGRTYLIRIHQHQEEYRQEIIKLLEKLGLKFSIGKGSITICNEILYLFMLENCGIGSENKHLPSWIFNEPLKIKQKIIESMYKGDGTKSQMRYTTKSRRLAEELVRLQISMGNWAKIGFDSGCYRVVWYSRRATITKKEKVLYSGKVYCVTTKKNHTVFAGRNDKFVLTGQSLYGVLGLRYFRYYNREKAELITSTGRRLINGVSDMIYDLYKIKTIYCDTDSVVIKLDDINNETIHEILERINREIHPYKMDLDKIFLAVFFLADESGEGVKKRYVGITSDGEWVWRGLETRRSDICPLAKRILKEVMEMILVKNATKEEIVKYLYDMRMRMMKGEFDEELVITVGVKEDPESYKSNTPQKRALEKLLAKGVKELPTGKISYVLVNGDVEPIFFDEDLDNLRGRLDYRRYWENKIYPPIKRILRSINVSRQTKLF